MATAGGLRDAPGWYGKLSSLGDFAQRRLPPSFVQACDTWLSAAMRGGREQLGERWLDVYLTAPLLRFAWAPGIVDTQWWFGLLMPSCDSVGRYFPLLIAQPRMRAPDDRIALDHLELWYDHLAHAAMGTLNDADGTVESLESTLQDAPAWPSPAGASMGTLGSGPHERLRLPHRAPLSRWVPAYAARELLAHLSGCSLWWRTDTVVGGDTLDVLQGLPDGTGLVRLLMGGEEVE